MLKTVAISGKKLADIRDAKLLTQSEMAKRLGMTAGNLSKLERSAVARMTVTNFRRLAAFVEKHHDDLLNEIGAIETSPANAFESFLVNRWAAMGEEGGLDEILDAAGIEPAELDALQRMKDTPRRHSPIGTKLLRALRFESWAQFDQAKRSTAPTMFLGYVKLTDGAYRIAAAEAKASGKDVGAWVSAMVEAASTAADVAAAEKDAERGKGKAKEADAK